MLNYFLVGLGGFVLIGLIIYLSVQWGKSSESKEVAEAAIDDIQNNIKKVSENEKIVNNLPSSDRSKLRSKFSKKRL